MGLTEQLFQENRKSSKKSKKLDEGLGTAIAGGLALGAASSIGKKIADKVIGEDTEHEFLMNYTFEDEYGETYDIEAYSGEEAVEKFKDQYPESSRYVVVMYDENDEEYDPETGKSLGDFSSNHTGETVGEAFDPQLNINVSADADVDASGASFGFLGGKAGDASAADSEVDEELLNEDIFDYDETSEHDQGIDDWAGQCLWDIWDEFLPIPKKDFEEVMMDGGYKDVDQTVYKILDELVRIYKICENWKNSQPKTESKKRSRKKQVKESADLDCCAICYGKIDYDDPDSYTYPESGPYEDELVHTRCLKKARRPW